MSDCSREAWNAPNGIEGYVYWKDGGRNKLNYTRFLDGAERKVDHIELDGERFVRDKRIAELEQLVRDWCDLYEAPDYGDCIRLRKRMKEPGIELGKAD